MSQLPMMPIFTDALIGDTMHLSTEEFGAYMLILFATWRNNGQAIVDDDKTMARICRVHISRWRQSLRPALIGFFTNGDGCLHQKRLEKEWDYSTASREKKSQTARDNALKRWKPGMPAAMPPHMPRHQSVRTAEKTLEQYAHNPLKNTELAMPAAMPQHKPGKTPRQPIGKNITNYPTTFSEKYNPRFPDNPLKSPKPTNATAMPPQCHGNAPHIEEDLSAPIQGRERSSSAARHAGDAAPPPATLTGVGGATPPAPEEVPTSPSARDDPKVRAEAIEKYQECLDALRGKAGTLAADATPPPQESDPRIAEFRARIRRLNHLASERLSGPTRTHAWEVLARADAINDPDDLPQTLADDLNAIEDLAAEAQ